MAPRTTLQVALAVACALGPSAAGAQPLEAHEGRTQRAEGTVVRIDTNQLFVDLGHATGVDSGSSFTVYRPITVRHPVTGRVLRDRFPIGAVVLEHAGDTLSLARFAGEMSRPPQVGDLVVPVRVVPFEASAPVAPASPSPTTPNVAGLRPAHNHPPPPELAPAAPELPPPPQAASVEERDAFNTFLATLGQPPEERVAVYQSYLRARPGSQYATSVRAEIESMRRLGVATRGAAPSAARPAASAAVQTTDDVPTSLRVGDPAVVALQVSPASVVVGGALFVRRHGASAYERVAMRVEGDGYLRAEVPASYVTPDGYEYFVETSRADGGSEAVLGRSNEPRAVEVLPPPEAPPDARGRSRVDLRGEFADVGTRTINGVLRAQRFFTVEGDFLQRLDSRVLYGYRVGFGVYDGDALALDRLDSADPTVHTRVIYGYHELEFALSDFVHLITRLQLGVFRTGLVPGGQARLRVGDERRTNIVLGGDLLGEVGQRAFFAFNFAPTPRLPMMAQGEVFNQSVAAGDPMFRVIAQAGWRLTPWFTAALRGSYQLRNIQNGGFGVGLSTTFDW